MARPSRTAAFWLLPILFCVATVAADADGQAEPYIGLSLRDTDRGPVVSWVFPGPLGGTGFSSVSGIRRSDLVTAVGGVRVGSAAEFNEAVRGLEVGATVTITALRAPDARPSGAVPDPGDTRSEGTRTLEFTITVADRDHWRGTIGRGAGETDHGLGEIPEGEFEAAVLETAATLELLDADGGLNPLLDHLRTVQERALDPNSLPVVVRAFNRPLSLDAVAAPIAERAKQAAGGDLEAVCGLIAEVLDVPFQPIKEPDLQPWEPLLNGLPEEYEVGAERLVRRMRDSVYIYDDHAESHIRVIRESPRIVERAVGESLARIPAWHAWVERTGEAHAGDVPIPNEELPGQVRAAVYGDVLHYALDNNGRVVLVVGGAGRNEFDMARIACVYSVGGDNVYRFSRGGARAQVIIDLEGDDTYIAQEGFCGPGTGVFGFSVIDDRGGDDVYRSEHQLSIGAGLFGVGVIIDHGGNDRYENTGPSSGWSMGAGFYGAGVIVSGGGNDVFLGEQLVQGVGGPRGFGAIINRAGNDLYRANGPNFPSVYGTPAVFATKGQGFGYGVRGYAAGGLGAIYDLAGNDRYEGGEFAQAGGYYFGMGVIHDFGGDDLYYGNRYGQAFAAHQAVGLLIDEGGDDTFWSMTAASQSGAWDESVTMLISRAGNDTFRCDGLGQGAAAHQSIALLFAAGGANHYTARAGSSQGRGGTNEYHHASSGVFSFSGFFDLAEGSFFSSGRTGVRSVGTRDESDPARSRMYGVFADR